MGDINSTNDVTIFDESNTNPVAVVLNATTGLYELSNHDQRTYYKINRSYPWQLWVEELKGFVLPANFTLASKNTEYDLMLLRNPVASGIDLHWWEFVLASPIAATNIILRGYRTPTITANGTAQTPRNLRVSGGASSVNVYAGPTITARGTLMEQLLLNSATGTFVKQEQLGYQIEPNEDMLITMEASSNGTVIYTNALWAELPTGV